MGKLDIKTLTDIIRTIDVEITAKRLAYDLGVSYSTFARANRTGSWPPSLTDGAMLTVIDDCRESRFDGDGVALANFVLAQLYMREVEVGALEEALACDGYDAFVSELLAQTHAAHPEGARERIIARPKGADYVPPAPPAIDEIDETSALGIEVSAPEVTPQPATVEEPLSIGPTSGRIRDVLIALPVALLLVAGMFHLSLTGFFLWAATHRLAFFSICLSLAVLPQVLGTFVDAPIAWHVWKTEHPDAPFDWRGFCRVAKYGAPVGVRSGAGRFNLTVPYLCYQPVCNLLVAFCCHALLSLLVSLTGFTEFFCTHAWLESLKASIVVAYYITLGFTRDQFTKPLTGDPASEVCENPDNYLPSRVHVWANNLFLIWTISFVIISLLALLAYSVINYRCMPAPKLLGWPYLLAALFFFFANLSPYAVRTRATGIGTFVPAMVALSICFAVLALVCYLPSPSGVSLALMCVACLSLTVAWSRSAILSGLDDWLVRWRAAGFYPIAVTLLILCLLIFGFVNLTFP